MPYHRLVKSGEDRLLSTANVSRTQAQRKTCNYLFHRQYRCLPGQRQSSIARVTSGQLGKWSVGAPGASTANRPRE